MLTTICVKCPKTLLFSFTIIHAPAEVWIRLPYLCTTVWVQSDSETEYEVVVEINMELSPSLNPGRT